MRPSRVLGSRDAAFLRPFFTVISLGNPPYYDVRILLFTDSHILIICLQDMRKASWRRGTLLVANRQTNDRTFSLSLGRS